MVLKFILRIFYIKNRQGDYDIFVHRKSMPLSSFFAKWYMPVNYIMKFPLSPNK
ncbi:hypothetical protein CNEO2_480014 [Clostridium neonatale]|nr:hypothetical protein CNEO2_480014 [Clostridium neonatale]CAI3552882.1 hypothetical protein CNEO4_260056 [Clostridium neonatale]